MTQVTKHPRRRLGTTRRNRPASPREAAACGAPLDDLLDADLFKALCDPTRLLLLACLAKCGRPCSVTDVAECCEVDFSVVSRHLALLERAGILEATRKGRTVYYRVCYTPLCRRLRNLADEIEACCPTSTGVSRGQYRTCG